MTSVHTDVHLCACQRSIQLPLRGPDSHRFSTRSSLEETFSSADEGGLWQSCYPENGMKRCGRIERSSEIPTVALFNGTPFQKSAWRPIFLILCETRTQVARFGCEALVPRLWS